MTFTINNTHLTNSQLITRLEGLREARKGTHWVAKDLKTHRFNFLTSIIWAISKIGFIFFRLRGVLGAERPQNIHKSLVQLKAQVVNARDPRLTKLFNEAVINFDKMTKQKTDPGVVISTSNSKHSHEENSINTESHGKSDITQRHPVRSILENPLEKDKAVTKTISTIENIKSKVGVEYFSQIEQRLIDIGQTIEKYYDPSGEKKEQFYEKLAEAIYLTGNNLKYVKTVKEDESLSIKKFLDKVQNNLLKPGSSIKDDFINIYMHKLASSKDNTGTATLSAYVFQIVKGKPSVLPGPLFLEGPSKINTILIPVNVNNAHWVLYTLHLNKEGAPLLRLDSLTGFSDNFKTALQELELKMVKKLKQSLHLPAKTSLYLGTKPVTQQAGGSNDCGVHVCKNAEWIAFNDGKVNPEGLEGSQFSQFRLDILLSII